MKKSQQTQKLEEVLRSSKIVSGGFLGTDTRSLEEIIQDDLTVVYKAGYTQKKIAERMYHLTRISISQLGMWTDSGDGVKVFSIDYKGAIVCPWPHIGKFAKRITHAQNIKTGKQICWTDLQIHMIAEHGFFEGRGSFFRLEPLELIDMIFTGI